MYCYGCNDWFCVELTEAGIPKPHKVIGFRRKYNDNTIPPLDFR